MSYKDKTFCYDWCGNEECDRNYIHTKEARDKAIPVYFFVMKPPHCTDWKDKVEHPNS